MAEADIIETATSPPHFKEMVEQPDGSMREAKYGDAHLEEAEAFLSGRYPHPWTVSKAIGWLHETSDMPTKIHLLRLLAASRDPRAALTLGEYFYTDLGSAPFEDLNDYFVEPPQVNGGTRSVVAAATKWFAANKERLRYPKVSDLGVKSSWHGGPMEVDFPSAKTFIAILTHTPEGGYTAMNDKIPGAILGGEFTDGACVNLWDAWRMVTGYNREIARRDEPTSTSQK